MKKRINSILCFILLIPSLTIVAASPSERRADWQIRTKAAKPIGREITQVDKNSPLAKAGIQVGDVLLSVNNNAIENGNQWWDMIYGLRAGNTYHLSFKRGLTVFQKNVQFEALPRETYSKLETEYGWIVSDYGIKQRTILTLPKNVEKKVPAIFVVGGLSCSSIEYTPGRKSNFIRSLRDIIQHSNMAVFRIEKPGVGDSEGRCSETDFTTELNGYEVALKTLLADKRIAKDKVVVYGSSMGSALAPYFANQYGLAGVISDGTFYRSWFEHMLEIERRILAMKGDDQATINHKITNAYIPLYYGMLVQKKSYAQLIEENPLLAEYNYHDPNHMYGRPMAFYHQMQDFNFAGEWSKLKAPARLRWGTNDWIMSEYDIDIIDEVLTENGNKDVKIYKYPGLDHWYTVHSSALNSFQGKPGKWDDKIAQQIVDWAQEML